jgi:hypothetical protein
MELLYAVSAPDDHIAHLAIRVAPVRDAIVVIVYFGHDEPL